MAVLNSDVLEGIKNAEVREYELIPDGEYVVTVDAAGLKPTRSGTGQFINATFTILGPKFQGRKLFANFNILNDSAEAARIGRQQVKSLMLASGMTQDQVNRFNDTDQLLGLTCTAVVDTEKGQGDFGPQNRIKRFKKAEMHPVPAPAFAPPPEGGSFSAAFAQPAAKPAASNEGSWFQ